MSRRRPSAAPVGDAGFASLYAVEATRLKRFLRRFGSNELAEDLVQESFAKACAAPLDAAASPRAYLFRIARNLAIDEARRRQRSPVRYTIDPLALSVPAPALSPEEEVLAAEAEGLVEAAIASLPERQRTALLLFKLERLPYKEIAKRMGRSHRSVEKYVADALEHCHRFVAAGE